MKFKANRDKLYLWIISLLNIVFGTIVIVFCLSETYLGAVLFLIAIAVINIQFFVINYYLKDLYLIIRFGVLKIRINYSSIMEIKETVNTYSSFATARHRLGIRIKKKKTSFYVYVSPKNEDEFKKILVEKCKYLSEEKRDVI